MKPALKVILPATVAAALAIAPLAARLDAADPEGEVFTGQLVYLETGDRMARFVLTCDVGVPEAAVDLRQTPGDSSPTHAISELPRRGSLRIADRPATAVVIVQSRPAAGGRQVIAVTDRPIEVIDGWSGRSEEKPLGAVVLELDAAGNGEGTLLPDATVSIAAGRVTVTNAGHPALRLIKVTTAPAP